MDANQIIFEELRIANREFQCRICGALFSSPAFARVHVLAEVHKINRTIEVAAEHKKGTK